MNIVIFGAGSIGCYTGGLLQQAGHKVTLLGRAAMLDAIRAHGLTLSDMDGLQLTIPAAFLGLSADVRCLEQAELIIVAVKSAATAEVAKTLVAHAPLSAKILSFQNGLEGAATLKAALPEHDVRAAMVPFNVVPMPDAGFHRASGGEIVIESGAGTLGESLGSPDLPISESEDIAAVQWGKLLLNLNNALNALSGLTLYEMLLDRSWRRLMADQMAEAMSVLQRAGIVFKAPAPVPTGLIPHILRLPTPVFRRVASRMLRVDPLAKTSMVYDLQAGRGTEIDALQGEIIRLASAQGTAAPIAQRVASAITAGQGPLLPETVRGG